LFLYTASIGLESPFDWAVLTDGNVSCIPANGHLKHPRGKMEGWKINPKIPMDEENFNLRADGTLQVKQPGLYFVYAQV
jgi:TNF(Tumour Necrosis Factor) family.